MPSRPGAGPLRTFTARGRPRSTRCGAPSAQRRRRSVASKSAHTSSTLSSSTSCRGTQSGLSTSVRSSCWVLTTQCPSGSKKVGLVRELQDAARVQRGLHLLPDPCSSVRCVRCLVAPPSSSPAASPCARSPRPRSAAAPPVTDDHRRGPGTRSACRGRSSCPAWPVLFAVQGAHKLLRPLRSRM